MSRPLRVLLAVLAVPALVLAMLFAPAAAHEEREATFPSGSGERPIFLGYDNPAPGWCADQGMLRYRFVLRNDGRLPVTVVGLAEDQPDPRLSTWSLSREQSSRRARARR
jgi:hypothetical protein